MSPLQAFNIVLTDNKTGAGEYAMICSVYMTWLIVSPGWCSNSVVSTSVSILVSSESSVCGVLLYKLNN